MGKYVTFSLIFEAQSLNYGEGIGNISELKKFTRMNGEQYTCGSRQALRYDIVRLGNELFGWNLDTVDKSKDTIQFKENITIRESEEMDLFGYMKTTSGKRSIIRAATVRLSFAVSLEPYKNDFEFLSNKGLADRISTDSNLANIEQHLSYYTYTVSIDLPKIGVDFDKNNAKIELPNEERYKRVAQFLDIIKILNRKIRGRLENLSPLFIVGGLYDVPNPFFMGRLKLQPSNNNKYSIDVEPLNAVLEMSWNNKKVKDDTFAGLVKNIFNNDQELEVLFGEKLLSVEEFFERMKFLVKNFYGV
jgi:CRISPR-associated protein Cst2